MIARFAPFGLALALAGCTGSTPRPTATAPRPPALPALGLERAMGKDVRALTALFGEADLDVREGAGRKLQYVGAACVLDAYLYPRSGGEAVVTWLDARTPQGEDIDRASCVAALSRRREAR